MNKFFPGLLITFLPVTFAYASQVQEEINYALFDSNNLSFSLSNKAIDVSVLNNIKKFTTMNRENSNIEAKQILLAGKICGDTYYSNDMYAECPRELVDPDGNFASNNTNQKETPNNDAHRAYMNAWDRTQSNLQSMATGTNDYERRLNGTYNNNLPSNGDAWQRYQDAQSAVQNNLQDMANSKAFSWHDD